MISQKMQDALNGQIVAEIWSANLYLSMSFFFEGEGFTGFANWMKKQSQEEMSHAYMIADFVIKRGGKAVLGQIDAVPQSWESPLADFLWQFVREQVEEEATASGIVDRLKRMGATAIFNLDQEYGARK